MRSRDRFLVIAILVILTAVFVLTPFFVRSLQGNTALLGQESYFHLGVAQNLVQPGSYPLPAVQSTGFEWLIAGFVHLVDPLIIAKYLPLLLGILSVIIFVWRSDSMLENEESLAAGLLFILSPIFLVAGSSLSPAMPILLLFLASWALYEKYPWVSIGVLLLMVFVDAVAFVVAGLLLLAYGLWQESWRPAVMGIGLGSFLLVMMDALFGFFAHNALTIDASLGQFFASLGAEFGYSFFILFLAFTGLVTSWRMRKFSVLVTVIVSGIFLLSFSEGIARVLLLPLIAVLAGQGILSLIRRRWNVVVLKNVTLFLIGLSLLFTVVMTINALVESEPSGEKIGALLFLRTVPEGDVVLSSPENGVFIERVARSPAFLDLVEGGDAQDAAVADRLFMSQRFSATRDLLEAYNISHILIDEQMRDGNVWTSQEQGLLFLLAHHPAFVKVYQQGSVEVYRFVQE